MSFWCSPKGTHHDRCRTTMIKHYFAIAMKANGIGWCSSRKDEPSPGCHGLSRLVSRNSFWCSPKWTISVLILFLKNELFKLTEGYPPRPVSQNYEKNTLPWKPMELGGVSRKDDESSPWDLYSMYVVLQGIESLTCIRVYTKFPLGSSNLDVWSSWTGTFIKQQVTRNNRSLFVLYLKTWVSQAHVRVPPTTGVAELWKKNYFALTTNGNRWCSSNNWWIFPLRLIFYVL